MEKIWAPWRMEYILNCEDEEGCFLCCARDCEHDRDALVLTRNGSAFLVMNRYPYANAHLMAVPNRHIGNLEELTQDELFAVMSLVQDSVRILKEAVGAQGFNIGINIGRVAGAGVLDHIHIHIVPRWGGDTNFMPILGETKIINEHILETYDRLRTYFD